MLEQMLGQVPARDAATDEALTERACAAVPELLDDVKVVEERDAVYAEVNPARWYLNYGAQERT